MTRVRGSRRRWLLAAFGLAAIIVCGNRGLFSGRAAPVWDAEWAYGPWFTLVADMARAGQLLLWNPWSNAGSPDCAEPQTGAFSPLVVGLGAALGGTLRGFCVYWLLTWCAAGWGMLLLARHLGAPPWGGFVTALGFAYSGFFTGHAEHTSFIHAFAALPWIIWRLDRALLQRQVRPAVEAGAVWGLSALAGYPAVVMLNMGLAVLWAAGRALLPVARAAAPRGRWAARAGHAGVSLGLAVTVGLLVLSPPYVGFLLETRGYSNRSGPLPREVAVFSNSLAPGAVATLASPYLSTLRLLNPDLWRETDLSSSSVYVGAVVVWLALCSLVARPRQGMRWWVFGLGLLGLGLALGHIFPFRGWLYDLVWPSRYFRHTALFRGWLIFALVVLAALATRDLDTASRRRRTRIARSVRAIAGLPAAGAVSVGVLLAFEGVVHATARHGPDLALARFHVVASCVVISAAAIAVTVRGRRSRAGLAGLLVAAAALDAAATQRLSAATIYTSTPASIEAWARALEEKKQGVVVSRRRSDRSPWDPVVGNRNLLPKRPVLASYGPLRNTFHVRWIADPLLVQAATGRDRFFFASRVVETPPSLAAFTAFRERAHVLGAPPLVVQPPRAMRAPVEDRPLDDTTARQVGELDSARNAPVRISRYLPDELVLTVRCPEDGWLLVTDRWAPSWRATVNGIDTPIWGGDFIFRAVAVRAGVNEVSFFYRPFGFPYLWAVSWMALAGVAFGSARALHDARRRRDPGSRDRRLVSPPPAT